MTTPTIIRAKVHVPYDLAVCRDPSHLRRRCHVGRTASGPGKRSFLHRFRDVRVQDVSLTHSGLERALRQVGLDLLDIVGGQLTSGMFVNGPYPAYIDGATRFAGWPSSDWAQRSPNVQQKRIFTTSGYNPDLVVYELSAVFLGAEIPPDLMEGVPTCLHHGDLPVSEVFAAS